MTTDPTDASMMISEPLLLADGGGTYSGLKVLAAADGEVSSLETKIYGQAISKVKGILPAFLGAALDGKDFAAVSQTTGDHWDILDRIIGRNTSNWMFWSTPPKLGYPNSTVDKEVTDTDLHAALPKHSIFYIMAHGYAENAILESDVRFEGIAVWKEKLGFDTRDHKVTGQEITDNIGENEYNLVFINACGGGNDSAGVATEYATAFKSKNYVSWNFPVTITSARGAAEQFFARLDNGANVSEATKTVQAARSSAGMGNMPVGGLGQTALKQVTRDDEVIIDLTPDPANP